LLTGLLGRPQRFSPTRRSNLYLELARLLIRLFRFSTFVWAFLGVNFDPARGRKAAHYMQGLWRVKRSQPVV
jgi:hypothetical protein